MSRRPDATARVIVCVVASALVHAALVSAVLTVTTSLGDRAQLEPLEITLLVAEPEERVHQPRAEPQALPRAASVLPREHRAPRGVERVSVTAGPLVHTAASSEVIVPRLPDEPSSERDREQERARLAAMINPLAVARASVDIIGDGPSMPGPPAGRTLDDDNPTEREREAALSASLHTEAMTKRYLERTRPEFRRRTDGTHVFSGHLFTAHIDECGLLTFHDRPMGSTRGFNLDGEIDIEGAIMQAQGQDPHAAERRWVEDHSQALRDQLGDACHRREVEASRRRLRGRLASTWSRTDCSARSRRRHMFDLWDETDAGADGAALREIVVAFIRENLPAGSEDAYSPEELAHLNARRTLTSERFVPY